MSQEQKLLPVEEEQKLLDRPAEERLREELDRQSADGGGLKPPRKAEQEKPRPSRKGLIIALIVALLVLGIIFLAGYLPRRARTNATRKDALREEQALPVVEVLKVARSPRVSRLLLPGNISALTEAPLYARASGYIVKRYVDIGDKVTRNELLAVIDAPELDQQVAQGRSQLAQARQQLGQSQAALKQSEAQLELAKVTWDRYGILVTRGAVSRQEADQQKANWQTAGAVVNASQANVRASEDNVRAAQANVDRLIALQSYKEVRAPFAGVITARNVDVGAYISTGGGQSGGGSAPPGNGGAAAQNGEIFRVAQIGRLRVFTNVPQADATNIRAGQKADILVQEYPNRRFQGTVTRTANSLDPNTRTLLTEVQVDNPKRELLPGMYAQVQFSDVRANPPVLVRGDSLLTRANGVFVAVLEDPDARHSESASQAGEPGDPNRESHPKQIHMQRVDVGRDYGTETEITSGLEGWEYVVTSPSDDVVEGALVLPSRASGPRQATPGGSTEKSPAGSGSGTSSTGSQQKAGGAGQSKR